MGVYDPLNAWLIAQPLNINYIPSTFEQIENVLGFTLPPTARSKPQWWENNCMRHSHANAWLNAGFLTQQVNLRNETLAFRRRD
jgi:hypothetical protein